MVGASGTKERWKEGNGGKEEGKNSSSQLYIHKCQ